LNLAQSASIFVSWVGLMFTYQLLSQPSRKRYLMTESISVATAAHKRIHGSIAVSNKGIAPPPRVPLNLHTAESSTRIQAYTVQAQAWRAVKLNIVMMYLNFEEQ
jgi:hypothetical protein